MAADDFTSLAANYLRRAAHNGEATYALVYNQAAEWLTEHGQPELAQKLRRIADLLNEADHLTLELSPEIHTLYYIRNQGGDYREALQESFGPKPEREAVSFQQALQHRGYKG